MAARFRNRKAAANVDTVDKEPSTPTEHFAKSAVILSSIDYEKLAKHTANRLWSYREVIDDKV
jgi:uncharacterized membrane-anchored protein YhcB (DUF1043 family)